MSIGNIVSTARNTTTMYACIPIGHLPIPPNRLDQISNYTQDVQELDALQLSHEVTSHILSHLSDASSQRGIQIVWCDETIRIWIPKVAA